jgi:hypothetical protein
MRPGEEEFKWAELAKSVQTLEAATAKSSKVGT